MIRPPPQVIKALALVSRQHPEILEWLEEWQMRELKRLPSAVENVAVGQGRCQVLGEITQLVQQSPEIAAKL